MEFLATPQPSDNRIKGKARSLAVLSERGLAVPKAFATLDSLFRALCPISGWPARLDDAGLSTLARAERYLRETPLPAGVEEHLAASLAGLGGDRFSVRSSFAGEDEIGRLAAGVYESRVGVAADGVAAAIRAVLVSAVSPSAVAYGLSRGMPVATGPMCVLVHPFLPGKAEGTVALALGEPVLDCRRGGLPDPVRDELFAAIRSFVADQGPTEMEWVLEGGRLYFLQARPFEPPRAPTVFSGFAALSPTEPPPSAWTWDAAHNPYPLSPAHRGLVEWVDEHCRIGIRQKVLGGYLFYAPDARPLPPAIAPSQAAAALAKLTADFERARADFLRTLEVETALALFVGIYEPIFGVIQPAVKKRRKALVEFLATHAPAALPRLPDVLRDVPTLATERRALAARIGTADTAEARREAVEAYLEKFGDEAPAWDIAEPTYAERPFTWGLPGMVASVPGDPALLPAIEAGLPPSVREQFVALLAEAREGVALSEADDWLYARAQACVRKAVRALGVAWVGRGWLDRVEDVFFLPLATIRRVACGGAPAGNLRPAVAEEREYLRRAQESPPEAPSGRSGVVTGTGIGGKVVGRVRMHGAGSRGPSGDAEVLVARTLLPTELPLVAAAALVVETGGPLDHVASQARERRMPAVVGATGACTVFRDGDRVLVDGDRGVVVKL